MTSRAPYHRHPDKASVAADYLVGTAQAGLPNEIVVGTTPGGELGGTWGSPTVDATHAGGTHIVAATQAEMETGTSTAVAVTPGRQQYHPGHPKVWALVDDTGAVVASYNVTSTVEDTTGDITITIATDFSSANWVPLATAIEATLGNIKMIVVTAKAAGSVSLRCQDDASNNVDPDQWSFVGFGDQS